MHWWIYRICITDISPVWRINRLFLHQSSMTMPLTPRRDLLSSTEGLIGCLAKIKSIFNKFLLLKNCNSHDCESTAVRLSETERSLHSKLIRGLVIGLYCQYCQWAAKSAKVPCAESCIATANAHSEYVSANSEYVPAIFVRQSSKPINTPTCIEHSENLENLRSS